MGYVCIFKLFHFSNVLCICHDSFSCLVYISVLISNPSVIFMLCSHLSSGLTPFAAAFSVLRNYNRNQEYVDTFYYIFLFVSLGFFVSFCKTVILNSSSIVLLTINLGFSFGIRSCSKTSSARGMCWSTRRKPITFLQ